MNNNNIKFFTVILAMFLMSALTLTGCMYAVASDKGESKPFVVDDLLTDIIPNSGSIDDAPASQSEMQKKFSQMSRIDEKTNTITVITPDYLRDFWQSNYEKEVIHSLTINEVLYIIQDSIRIYMEYDKIILSEFACISSDMNVAERFPYVEGQEICKSTDSGLQSNKAKSDIYKIITYRLKALSSPKAFFTGEEAIRFVGDLPGIYSTMLPFASIYIPGYSANTDRDYIISVIGNSAKSNSPKIDTERYSDLFIMWEKSGEYIAFEPKAESKQQTKLFPTEEML